MPYQLFAYLFLIRTSKLLGNRQNDFLSFNKLKFWSNVRNFRSRLRAYGLYFYMFFYNIIDIFFKVKF